MKRPPKGPRFSRSDGIELREVLKGYADSGTCLTYAALGFKLESGRSGPTMAQKVCGCILGRLHRSVSTVVN